jgi:uncharacterized membrane protein
MRPEVAWLQREIPGLVERGVISPQAADALRRHYASAQQDGPGVSWGQVLLACFGALLVGGGIILILAHNWDDLGRPVRAAIAIGLLLAAQALTLYAVLKRPDAPAWTESTSAFLVAAVGAAIALVGQTYHVGGSFEGLLRAWLWLVVLLPYVTGSSLASLLTWALLIVRVTNVSWRDEPLDLWLLTFAALPFVVLRLRRDPTSWPTSLVAMAAGVSIFVTGTIVAAHGWNGLWAVFQVSFLAAAIGAASWPPAQHAREPWRGRLLTPASLALIVIATILTFDDSWRGLTIAQRQLGSPSLAITAVVAVACAAFASIVAIRLARSGEMAAACGAAAALIVVVMHALTMLEVRVAGWIAFNLWLLAFGVLTLVHGVRTLTLWRANIGLFALASLVVARFFDTDLSFLARGLAFVAFGVACLVLNVWLMRRMRGRAAV